MSYGLKFQITSFRDLSAVGNNLWRIHISKSGYSGPAASITGQNNVVGISYKKQSIITAINGSECIIGLQATSAGQYDEFLTAPPLAYWLQVYKSTDGGSTYNLYWQGVNTTDTFSEAVSMPPYVVNLKFNCGLGELQFHRYENSNTLFESFEQVIQILNNCFSFLPYSLNIREIINIREDTMNDTQGLFEQLYLDDVAFYEIGNDQLTHGKSCLTVLNMICTALNCRIYQSNNMWFVERIYERVNTSVTYYDYTTGAVATSNLMTHSATGTLNWTRTISNSTYPKLLDTSEQLVTQKNPIIIYNLETNAYNNDQLVPNPFFEDTPTSKNAQGLPLRWDRSSDVQTHGGDGLVLVSPFDPDPKYRWAYNFGSYIQGLNVIELDGTSGFFPGTSNSYPSTYSIHGVLSPGDTYTRPWVYVDTVNGTLNINLNLFIEVAIQVPASFTPKNSNHADSVAYLVMTNMALQPTFKIQLKSGGTTYSIINWASPYITSGDQYLQGYVPLSELCQDFWYPNDNLTQQTMNASYLGAIMQQNIGKTFTLKFRYSKSFNIPLTAITSSGIYNFDVKCYPAYYNRKALQGYPGYTTTNSIQTWSFAGYGINAIDVQYKDNFLSATPYMIFYASGDSTLRWKELQVNVQLGDSLTPGYPGSFRINTGAQTGTWHNLPEVNVSSGTIVAGTTYLVCGTLSITYNSVVYTAGQKFVGVVSISTYSINSGSGNIIVAGLVLADILFQKFAQIPAHYRKNIKGHLFDNTLQYYHSIVDEDGTVYMQGEHTFDVKNNAYQTDMEEMADIGLTINPTKGVGTTGLLPPWGNAVVNTVKANPLHTLPSWALVKVSGVSTIFSSGYTQ